MDHSDEHKQIMADVFRRIGRNVFVFQQIELMLKFLLSNGRFEGTVHEFAQLAQGGAEKPDKRTLGQLVTPLMVSHFTPVDPSPPAPTRGKEATISYQLTFGYSPEERASFQKQLEAVVAERNDLIHTLLARFRFESVADCEAVCIHLDQQHIQITPVKNDLSEMVKVLQKISPELWRHLWQQLENHQGDQPRC